MIGETTESFECFGGRCAVRVTDPDKPATLAAVEGARHTLLEAHRALSRFDPDSELSRLNRDPRRTVPVSPLLRQLVAAALSAGVRSGGLVDATLVDEIEACGYAESRDFSLGPAAVHLSARGGPATPSPRAGWCELAVDERAGTVSRPPGLRVDPGGIAKGLMADLIAEALAGFRSFAVDCCGDLRVGGTAGRVRAIQVGDPSAGTPLHELRIASGAVATSGITRRSWVDADGRAAHQILDPATGLPAFTGIVQATAVAPTGLYAETLAKAALLAGPDGADAWLPYGGVIVTEDGDVRIVDALTRILPEVLAA
jgi:thiamine biosynthesis lipoprotein